MISIEYYIQDGTSGLLWPAVIRKTLNGSVLISEEAVTSSEAQLAGVDIAEYFSAYKAYIETYLTSLTTYLDEVSIDQMNSHLDVEAATKYFNFFMSPMWQQEA